MSGADHACLECGYRGFHGYACSLSKMALDVDAYHRLQQRLREWAGEVDKACPACGGSMTLHWHPGNLPTPLKMTCCDRHHSLASAMRKEADGDKG